MKIKKIIPFLFPIVFLTLAILHSIFPQITIDAITIALIILAFLPWLPSLIKEITLPGGTKITFRDLKEPSENIIEEGKSEDIEPKFDEDDLKRQKQLEYSIMENPSLALVSVRIEIEKRIRELAQIHLKPERIISLKRTVSELVKKQILSPSITGSLLELIHFGNKAAHGEEVSDDVVDWALEYAPKILSILDQYIDKVS